MNINRREALKAFGIISTLSLADLVKADEIIEKEVIQWKTLESYKNIINKLENADDVKITVNNQMLEITVTPQNNFPGPFIEPTTIYVGTDWGYRRSKSWYFISVNNDIKYWHPTPRVGLTKEHKQVVIKNLIPQDLLFYYEGNYKVSCNFKFIANGRVFEQYRSIELTSESGLISYLTTQINDIRNCLKDIAS